MVWFRNFKRNREIKRKMRKLGKTHVHNNRKKGVKKNKTSSVKKK